MAAYISVPFVAKKTVACEPVSKQESTEQVMPEVKAEVKEEVASVMVEEKIVEAVSIKEEPKEEPKEEVKEELSEERRQQLVKETLKDCMEIEATMAKVGMSELRINVPEEDAPIVEHVAVTRAPEFVGQFNSESHAVKKFNKKHRKH